MRSRRPPLTVPRQTPMTDAEKAAAVAEMRSPDATPEAREAARSRLVGAHVAAVSRIADRGRGRHDDDISGELIVELVRLVDRYDPACGYPIGACVASQLRFRYWRLRSRLARDDARSVPETDLGPDGVQTLALAPDRRGDYWQGVAESSGAVAAAADALLGPRDADVIRAVFGLGRPPETEHAVALRHGVTREWVRQIRIRSVRKLRAAMAPGAAS